MAGMPSISVSIVVYSPNLSLLGRTLDSLAGALLAGDVAGETTNTLLLIDNSRLASADVCALLEAFSHRIARIGCTTRYLHGHGNVGYGRGHNLALSTIQSEFHLILNPDVELDQDALKNAFDFLAANPDVGLVVPMVRNPLGEQEFLCKRYPSVLDLALRGFAPGVLKRRFAARMGRYEMRDAIGPDCVFTDPPIVSGCWMMFRTSVLKRLGGFDPEYFLYFEDFDLSLRAASTTRIAYVPSVRITHFGGNAARKGIWHVWLFARSAALFFRRHGWRWF